MPYDSREEWREIDRESRRFAGRGMVWTIVAVLFFGLIGVGVWGFRVATSDVKGRGDAVQTKNSAVNRIAAQERFEDRYSEIKKADRNLDVLAADKKANPTDKDAATRYTGAVSYCLSVVADYNADARKYTSEQFRAADLPAQIDNLDPTTDCKESK